MLISFVFPSLNPSYYKMLLLGTKSYCIIIHDFYLSVLPFFLLLLQVAELTDSVQQIADALQGSPVVEVQVFLVSICGVLYLCMKNICFYLIAQASSLFGC